MQESERCDGRRAAGSEGHANRCCSGVSGQREEVHTRHGQVDDRWWDGKVRDAVDICGHLRTQHHGSGSGSGTGTEGSRPLCTVCRFSQFRQVKAASSALTSSSAASRGGDPTSSTEDTWVPWLACSTALRRPSRLAAVPCRSLLAHEGYLHYWSEKGSRPGVSERRWYLLFSVLVICE